MESRTSAKYELLDRLADEFAERFRRGERPSVKEYMDRYPDLAADIAELLPALAEIAQVDLARNEVAQFLGTQTPKQVGDYRLLREIGRGGMGIVYEAEQISLGRRVALKLLPLVTVKDGKALERFQREARAAAQLHHTNIVPVFEVGQDGDVCYYAMQFIQGQGLDQVVEELRRHRQADPTQTPVANPRPATIAERLLTDRFLTQLGPGGNLAHAPTVSASEPGIDSDVCTPGPVSPRPALPPTPSELSSLTDLQYYRRITGLGIQLTEGLAHAHKQGILHRDIKPSNLLLDPRGTLWITDFGLAWAEGNPELTGTGEIVGTFRYMAPERFQGRGDLRSDIYSAGATLYELLTLEPLYGELSRGALMSRILLDEPIPPRRLDPHLPRDLETIILKAIAREPSRRYTTADELVSDLRRFLDGEPIRARRTSAARRTWLWCRRNPAVAMLSLALALMACVVTVVSVVMALRQQQAAGRALVAERDAREQLFESLVVQARAGRSTGRPGQRLAGLAGLQRAVQLGRELRYDRAEFVKLRNEAIACLALSDLRLEREWEGNVPGLNGLAFDARLEHYAWSRLDEGLRVCRTADHEELFHLPTLPANRLARWMIPAFSPDGRFLAVWYDAWTEKHPLEVWKLKPGVHQPLASFTDTTRPGFSPDGRTLAFGLPDNTLRLIDLQTGGQIKQLTSEIFPERLTFHPDGRKLAVTSVRQFRVQVRDLEDGHILYDLAHPAGVQAAAWHPDGSLLATGCNDQRIYLWDGVTDERRRVMEGHRWEVADLAFNQRGDCLGSFGWDMTGRLWEVPTGKQICQLDNVRLVSFRRDAELGAAAITGRRVQVWAQTPSAEYHVLRGSDLGLETVGFSPNGRYVHGLNVREPGCVWNVGDQRLCGRLPRKGAVVWDAQGRILTTENGRLERWSVSDLEHPNRTRADRPGPAPLPGAPQEVYVLAWCGVGDQLLAQLGKRDERVVQAYRVDGAPVRVWERPVVGEAVFLTQSQDGRWLGVGADYASNGPYILNAATGAVERQLPTGDADLAFSRDSRWLLTTTGRLTSPEGELSLWRTDNWEKVKSRPLNRSSSSPGVVAVSPDGQLVAVARTISDLQILRLETLEEIATFTSPDPGLMTHIEFSPDGRYLAAAVGNAVQLWDLQLLRRQLADMGLDWEALPPGAAAANDSQVRP
jgi:serine/threonine protein kinase/WD40 repeat protein